MSYLIFTTNTASDDEEAYSETNITSSVVTDGLLNQNKASNDDTDAFSNNEDENENSGQTDGQLTSSYPVDSCLQPVDIDQEILDTNGKIFCQAPGKNMIPKCIFKEAGIDAMAFPYMLPDGQFGLSMDREEIL